MRYNPRGKRTTLMPAIAMAVLGAVVAIPALSSSLHAAAPVRYQTITVQRGDSLWALADRVTPADESTQETVDRIMAVNHLSSATVAPGEHLRIPR